jgi:hypothetical protein
MNSLQKLLVQEILRLVFIPLAHISPDGKSVGSKLCRIPHKSPEKNVETPKWM